MFHCIKSLLELLYSFRLISYRIVLNNHKCLIFNFVVIILIKEKQIHFRKLDSQISHFPSAVEATYFSFPSASDVGASVLPEEVEGAVSDTFNFPAAASVSVQREKESGLAPSDSLRKEQRPVCQD